MPTQIVNTELFELLLAIVSCVCRKTEEPAIMWDEKGATFSVQVDVHDQGRMVGKKGTVIWSLKTIFWYAGLNQIQRTADIELLEPDGPTNDRRAVPFKPNPQWDKKKISGMLDQLLSACFSSACYTITETSPADAAIVITPKASPSSYSEPNLTEAVETVMRAAGMANGCNIKTSFAWP